MKTLSVQVQFDRDFLASLKEGTLILVKVKGESHIRNGYISGTHDGVIRYAFCDGTRWRMNSITAQAVHNGEIEFKIPTNEELSRLFQEDNEVESLEVTLDDVVEAVQQMNREEIIELLRAIGTTIQERGMGMMVGVGAI